MHAADICQDDTLAFLKVSDVDLARPRGFYHRQCYQTFANEKTLEKLQVNRASTGDDDNAISTL